MSMCFCVFVSGVCVYVSVCRCGVYVWCVYMVCGVCECVCMGVCV